MCSGLPCGAYKMCIWICEFPCSMNGESATHIFLASSHDRARMLVMLYELGAEGRGICQHGPCDERSRNMLARMLSGADPMSAKRCETLHADNFLRSKWLISSIACEEYRWRLLDLLFRRRRVHSTEYPVFDCSAGCLKWPTVLDG